MQRRKFLRTAGVGGGAVAAAGTLAAPAVAQSMPEVKWRLASSFPKSLDTIYGAGEFFAKRVAALTDNKFQIRVFAAGEIVPGLQVVDAVQNETVECGHTASYYYVGKDPTFAFDTAVPFGLNTRQHNAWVYFGGGLELMREFYKDYKMTSFLMSHTGAQMGGWWRKEIKSARGHEGREDAHRRLRRPGHGQARRGAAADRRRRHLSGAGEGHDRCRRVGRPLRRPEARLQQGRAVLLLSRLVGGQPRRCRSIAALKAFEALPADVQGGDRRPPPATR